MKTKRFLNNYNNAPQPSVWRWQWERLTTSSAKAAPYVADVIATDVAALKANGIRTTLTWIGHSSLFLQLQGLNILMDPVFSERASPVSFLGPKRQGPLPFNLQECPRVDVVVISHNHYDHLDLETLKQIDKSNQGETLFLVPLGNKKLLEEAGITCVREMDWWDTFSTKTLTFTFTPTQHWSARGLWDRNKTLWGGWMIASSDFKVFFVGDSGYSKDFQDIYEKLGAVDVALIPIGAYAPRWFMRLQHVDTAEAVKIHQDLHSKFSIGIHWGTFRLSDEPLAAPPKSLFDELLKAKVSEDTFRVIRRGETLEL